MEQLKPVVLIVEDEFLLRMDSAAAIEEAGFEVVEAANADEAIAILRRRSDIGVVFTDIQMPGSMDGLKLARLVRDRWPPIKIIATSGRVALGEGDLPEGGVFIAKPIPRQGLPRHSEAWPRDVSLMQPRALTSAEEPVIQRT